MLNRVSGRILMLLVISLLFLSKAEADAVKVKGLGEIRGVIERETDKEVALRVKGGKVFLYSDEIEEITKASKEENDALKQKWEALEGTQKLKKYSSESYKIYIVHQKSKGLLQYQDIEVVKCSDNIHSYAVCLPSDYEKREKCPVLFCFDAGGDGATAVGKFAFAAEKYGWILVGSLDAKNGPWSPILKAQSAMLEDIKNRYNVDQEKYYAAGFSGGARMSYTIAYKHPFIFKGVVACGSGFGRGHISKNVAVYHCIGDKDSNLTEVKKAHTKLIRKRAATKLNIFPGEHSWPPDHELRKAVTWIASFD